MKVVYDTNILISGDKHLLDLKSYKGIERLSARDFLIKIGKI